MPDAPTTQWNLLAELTQKRLDERTRALSGHHRRRDEAIGKLDLLLDYRRAYEAQYSAQAEGGIGADALRNRQSFAATLERAIEEQSDRLAQLQQVVVQCESEVRELTRRVHSFGILEARRVSGERVVEARRQQAATDEMASRMRLAS